jgi:energy-coupling factor transporter ATP-binding protein EcfA2
MQPNHNGTNPLAVEAINVTRSLPVAGEEIAILNGISFNPAGGVRALTGPSGSGKSTLLGIWRGSTRHPAPDHRRGTDSPGYRNARWLASNEKIRDRLPIVQPDRHIDRPEKSKCRCTSARAGFMPAPAREALRCSAWATGSTPPAHFPAAAAAGGNARDSIVTHPPCSGRRANRQSGRQDRRQMHDLFNRLRAELASR